MDSSFCFSCTSGGSNMVTEKKKKKKVKKAEDASKPQAPLKFKKVSGEEKRAAFFKSEGRDPEATGKKAEDQLRRAKGLKPHPDVKETREQDLEISAEPTPEESEKRRELEETGLLSREGESPEQHLERFNQIQAETSAEFQARAEGRKPLDEMMLYQQFLLAIATTGGAKLPGQFGTATGGTEAAIGSANKQQIAANKVGSTVKQKGNYAVNGKTASKSGRALLRRGLSGAAVAFIAGAFGTYPFTLWAQQETLGGIRVISRDLREAGEFEEVEKFNAIREEIHRFRWDDLIPYNNIIRRFKEFVEVDKAALKAERKLVESSQEIVAGEKVSQFDLERRGSAAAVAEGL